jgi:hypothetical protein
LGSNDSVGKGAVEAVEVTGEDGAELETVGALPNVPNGAPLRRGLSTVVRSPAKADVFTVSHKVAREAATMVQEIEAQGGELVKQLGSDTDAYDAYG